jgi:hypothetical protein
VLADGPPTRDEDDPVGDLLQLGEDLAGHQHGGALGGQSAQDVAKLHSGPRIVPRGGLVKE